MKACCCCSARIGSFVGLTLSVIFSLAFGGFFWSGGAENFSVDAATRAIEFCQYPKNITAAYREPSVCNHDKDPCTLVDDVTATIDDYTEDITTQNALGGLFGVPLLLGIIAVVVGFIGVCMKSGVLTKVSACLIIIIILCVTAGWIGSARNSRRDSWRNSGVLLRRNSAERRHASFSQVLDHRHRVLGGEPRGDPVLGVLEDHAVQRHGRRGRHHRQPCLLYTSPSPRD